MSRPFEQVKKMLVPGQAIILEPGSPIYKGPYRSHVLDISGERVRVGMPLDQGKLVLLPVGTKVRVKTNSDMNESVMEMEIVMRTGGKDRALFLSPVIPDNLQDHPKQVNVSPQPTRTVPVIAVSSGKGGVGKTTFTINLALALSRMGHKVCVVDGDLGTANVDVLFNLASSFNLAHVVHGQKHLLEVLVEGPEGLIVLPGGSGFQELTTLSDDDFAYLLDQFRELEEYADYILIDTGSGLSPSVTNFLLAATETILITTTEPHAVTDCYALIKVLAGFESRPNLRLVVNRVESAYEGKQNARKMAFASKKFLGTEVDVLGHISEDPVIIRSIRKQKPVLIEDPKARSSMDISAIAHLLVSGTSMPVEEEDRSFLERMRDLLWRRRTSS